MIQKLDLAENTRYRQAGFEGTRPTFRHDFSLRSAKNNLSVANYKIGLNSGSF